MGIRRRSCHRTLLASTIQIAPFLRILQQETHLFLIEADYRIRPGGARGVFLIIDIAKVSFSTVHHQFSLIPANFPRRDRRLKFVQFRIGRFPRDHQREIFHFGQMPEKSMT